MNHISETQLNEYLDEMLDASTRKEVETHLALCVDCRTRLEALQFVFARLGGLPEIPLAHDLTPVVLAKLPKKTTYLAWQRSLAIQWGVVAGFMLWLGLQAGQLIKTEYLSRLWLIFSRRDFQLVTFDFFVRQFDSLRTFSLPAIQLPIILPIHTLPKLDIPFTSLQIILLGVLVFLLWVIGNVTLLRGNSRVQK